MDRNTTDSVYTTSVKLAETKNQDVNFILGIILCFIVITGLVGNVLSLLIWLNGERCRKLPGNVYFIALSTADIAVLLTGGVSFIFEFVFQIKVINLNTFFCKSTVGVIHLTLLFSTWTTTSLTLERTIIILSPIRSAGCFSRKRTVITLISFAIMATALSIPIMISKQLLDTTTESGNYSNQVNGTEQNISNLEEDNQSNKKEAVLVCETVQGTFLGQYENIFHRYFIDLILLFLAPLITLMTCNIIMCIKLFRSNAHFTRGESQRHNANLGPVLRTVTIRVLAVNIIHCLTTGPYSIAALVPGLLDAKLTDGDVQIFWNTLQVWWFVNNAANFIMYNLTGTAFRRDLCALVCKTRATHMTNWRASYELDTVDT